MSGPRSVPLEEKLWLSLDEASALTGLSSSALWRLVMEGLLPRVPHTKRRLIARAELERFGAQS